MNHEQLAQLVEANQNLVVAVLKAHAQRAIDEKKIQDITQSAKLDALTQLPNRLVLLDRLDHAIVNAKRCNDQLALIFIDLNKFKHINATLGHATGDEVLKTAAHCMTKSVRESDTVSRQGGDEFVILLEKVSKISDVTSIVKKILSFLGEPNRVGLHTIRLTASVGISLYPDDGNDAQMLLSLADSAMYRAKRIGNGSFVFSGEKDGPDQGTAGLPSVHPFEITLDGKEQRREYRRRADENMVSATLVAQDLQAGAEQALRRQTEFMAMLAHELRNPLGPISNAAMLIRQAPADVEMAMKVHALINKQVVHMTKLLDDVFDMARITTGTMRIERECIDIVKLIGQVVNNVQSSIDVRQQKLQCTLPDFPVNIVGDQIRLAQIFGNLLDNASKYTPTKGQIVLTVEVDEMAVVIRISDTGIGITAEALPNVFQMFVQDTHASRFNGKGLGIGLALVKDLVDAHHGTVTAHSDGPDLGSQFTVTLPKKPGPSDAL